MADTRAPALQRADFIRQAWPLISPWQHAPYLRENAQQAILKQKWAEADAKRDHGDPAQK